MTNCNTRPPPESGPVGGVPTARQLEVLAFISDFKDEHDMAPTLREICERFDFSSTNGANDFLVRLERGRLLTRKKAKARSLRLTESGKAAVAEYHRQRGTGSQELSKEGERHV